MPRDLEAIEPGVLESVTGGRRTQVDQIDPALVQRIGELAQAVTTIGQTLAATKQQSNGQLMQMMQLMQGAGTTSQPARRNG